MGKKFLGTLTPDGPAADILNANILLSKKDTIVGRIIGTATGTVLLEPDSTAAISIPAKHIVENCKVVVGSALTGGTGVEIKTTANVSLFLQTGTSILTANEFLVNSGTVTATYLASGGNISYDLSGTVTAGVLYVSLDLVDFSEVQDSE